MRIYGIGYAPKWRGVVLVALLSTGLLMVQANSSYAFGGSSGGSLGSSGGLGSGGSSGGSSGGGLFGGRRPVRNLLGRLGSRNYNSSGGSTGGFGSHGSSGSSLGSTGSSWGSTGSLALGASSGGSSTGFSSSVSSYGSSGSSYLGQLNGNGSYNASGLGYSNSVYSDPMATSPIYDSGASFGSIMGSNVYDSGVIGSGVVDPGFIDSGMPIDSGYPGYSLDGTTSNGGLIETNSFNPLPGINYEGGTGTQLPGAVLPSSESTTPPTPPNPGPAENDDSTSVENSIDHATVLNLELPADAMVYINDKLTRTPGAKRSYVSRNLKPVIDYHYHVKAVIVRNGKEIVRNQIVTIESGATETVKFDFESTPVTSLALIVPADAKVILCGKETAATGEMRHYATEKLDTGMTWKDYTIEVQIERDGKVVRQEKKLDMLAGETYSFDFEFDSTDSKIAAK